MWDTTQTGQNKTLRSWSFVSILLLTAILFWSPLKAGLSLSFHDERYLPIAAAPFLCAFLLWWERKEIFPQAQFSPREGAPWLAFAMLSGLALMHGLSLAEERAGLALTMLAVIAISMSAFFLCYGPQSFRKALFALGCLLLMIPVPEVWMERLTVGLEHGSAVTSWMLFRVLRIPVSRENMVLNLPGLTLLVAPECSGIRSWLGFLLGAIVTTRLYLRSGWGMVTLIAMTVPIAIFKNAIRIVLLGALTIYVNRGIIDGPLHHQGGPVFAIIDLAIFVPLLILFQRLERSRFPVSAYAAAPTSPAEMPGR